MANETKILYVDDEIVNQYLFKMNSSKYYQVVTASSGDEGLELLENDKEIRLENHLTLIKCMMLFQRCCNKLCA